MSVENGCKGSLLTNTKKYVETTLGHSAWAEIISSLPPADGEVLTGLILSASWYPIGLWNRLMTAYNKLAPGEPKANTAALAHYVAKNDLSTWLRVLLKLATPETVMRRVPSLYSRYFSSGAFTQTTADRPRAWTLTLRAGLEQDGAPDHQMCRWGIPAWIGQTLELVGAKDPTVRKTDCRFRGAPECRWEVTWQP